MPHHHQPPRRLLGCCHHPITVADLASDVNLPLGVVRVLVSDVAAWGAVGVIQGLWGPVTDERLLRNVLAGLQAL